MNQPTYQIAQALHARRAAVGLPKYGQHLTGASPGCMIVHAIEEAADLTEYLIAEVQRRKIVMETLNELSKEMHAELAISWAYRIEKLYDLLGGKSAIEKYDDILGGGTVAENATVAPDPRDEALRMATEALESIDHLVFSVQITEIEEGEEMTRDEVLERLDRMADKANMEAMSSLGLSQPTMAVEKRKQAELLRAAAELIRAGGWRPISEAPEGRPVTCGKHTPGGFVWLAYRFFSAAHAAKESYTYYLPDPEPPAREVENG